MDTKNPHLRGLSKRKMACSCSKPPPCKCEANCSIKKDPHVFTFDGTQFKTNPNDTEIMLYKQGKDNLNAFIGNNNYISKVVLNNKEIMDVKNCNEGETKKFLSTTKKGELSGSVLCVRKRQNKFLEVDLTKVDFINNQQQGSDFMNIEHNSNAQGVCMKQINGHKPKPLPCTCSH